MLLRPLAICRLLGPSDWMTTRQGRLVRWDHSLRYWHLKGIAKDEQHERYVVHAFTGAENVSLVNSRISVVKGNMYYNVPHMQLTFLVYKLHKELQIIAHWS